MKKFLLLLLMFPISLFAAPFLVCDQQAANPIDPVFSYTVAVDAMLAVSTPATPTGTYGFQYDLGPLNLAVGLHSVSVFAVDSAGNKSVTVAISFTINPPPTPTPTPSPPPTPLPPANLRVVPQ